ncbi:hypothetical protein OAH33_00385 [bacterium]|nr:hypothetical protein [bacterium]
MIEVTGHPCSGKTYILNKIQYKDSVFKKYVGIFRAPRLLFLVVFYTFIDELVRDLISIVCISNEKSYTKLVLIFNIVDKYYYANRLKSPRDKIMIDEGAIHIIFNLLTTDESRVWEVTHQKEILHRLPQPEKLFLVRTSKEIQAERLSKRGHKRMKDANDFIRITREVSKYIELNFRGDISVISNAAEFKKSFENA